MLISSVFWLFAAGLARSHPLVIHEKRGPAPSDWKYSHRIPADYVLPLRIGLTQSNLHNLETYLMNVSHPGSLHYGKHWTPEKVAATFAPTSEAIESVGSWLQAEGFQRDRIRLTAGRNWFTLNATVSEVEALLNSEYHVFKHKDLGIEHVACNSYSVPANVRQHVDIITPTVHFDRHIMPAQHAPTLRKRTSQPLPGATRQMGQPGIGSTPKFIKPEFNVPSVVNQLENCDTAITPDCLRALYSVNYTPVATANNSYAIVEYTPQAFLATDLDMFYTMFEPAMVGTRPDLVSIDGGVAPQGNGSFGLNGESDLDLQYGSAISHTPLTLYQVGDLVEGASFNNLLDALDGSYCTFEGGDDPSQDGIYPDPAPNGFKGQDCGTVKPANVISTSYSFSEVDATPAYNIRQCNEYAKLGLLGVSIVYSSGDQGVSGRQGVCINPNGTTGVNGTLFNPRFPSACPFVTAVGATQVSPNNTVNDPESACEQVIFSGGGFSNVFARPSYQADAVNDYLTNHFPTEVDGHFNNSGSRGFPDVSANGANYVVAVDGEFELVFGTSCSAPVFGAILTLVNDARLAAGKSPVGFVNPTIYSDAFRGAFNDITIGGNQGCGTPGFQSVPGWDPVTGLGTPNLAKLMAAWLELP